ncbi:MAG: biotin/lipoyl-containing protein [Candidatus Eisenbacteria bacterium]
MKYVVHIMGEDVELDISHGSDGTTVTVGDRAETADLVRVGSSPVYSLTLGGRSYEFSAHRKNGGYEIVLDGEPYSAGVMDERAMLIAAASGPADDGEAGETVSAPMPGVVVGIAVEVGAEVEPGQGIVTLEAMKMENELKSERGGVVKAVRVSVGQGVAQGETLIELE